MGERFDKLPIAALTANVVVGMKEVFLQNGFDDFMAKPIEMAKLHEFIERWVPIEKRVYTDRHAVSLRRLDTESRSLAEKRQLAERRLMTDRRGLSAAMTPSGKWRPVRGAAKQDAPANAPGALGSAGEGAKAAAGLEGLAGIEGLDTGIGLVSAGGSPSAYMELLNIFCRDVYSRIDFMNTPSAERDIYTFATHAHALKSACASIGATALSQEAKLLEDAGKRDDIASIRQGVSGFRDRMTRLTERIATALSAEAKGRPGGRGADGKNTTEAIAPALLGLKKMLGAGDAGDAAAAAAILSELLEMPLDGDVKEALSRASGMVAASDLPGAAKMIEGISG
jgi:HPt (histidine-containing phosphotransfer) domain-containing protein